MGSEKRVTTMPMRAILTVLGVLSIWAGQAVAADKKTEKPKTEIAKSLAEAHISQDILRVYLNRPAAISLYNARGQLLFHLESSRPSEVLPLQGVPAGFLYLTARSGKIELTKKLVYTGK